jgi:hypothetical protein
MGVVPIRFSGTAIRGGKGEAQPDVAPLFSKKKIVHTYPIGGALQA